MSNDMKPSHPVCPAGEYCIPASLANELQAKIDELTARNKELCASISTIANLPHTCSETVGPRQCPPCAAHLYAYAHDQAENRANENERREAKTEIPCDRFNAEVIAATLIRELIADERSLWLRLIKQERLKKALQYAYDRGKTDSEAQKIRLRAAVFNAAQTLQETLKTLDHDSILNERT